jgi:hypothetical protein
MHKDITEYKPKIILGLSIRMIISIAGAVGVAVLIGLYCTFVLGLPVEDAMPFIYVLTVPFWCFGFIKPRGMVFEKFLPLFLRHQLSSNRIFYVSSVKKLYDLLAKTEKDSHGDKKTKGEKNGYVRFRRMNGTERWEPGCEWDSIHDVVLEKEGVCL